MNNYFNPFDEFEKKNEIVINNSIKKNTDLTSNKSNKVNKYSFKNYNQSVAHRYLSNNNNNNDKPSIINLIKNTQISDQNSLIIIKYLYKNIKDDKYKQELIEILTI